RQLDSAVPLVHISDWENGIYLTVKDPALLMALGEWGLIPVGFDCASLPWHAGTLTREGLGHAGIILFSDGSPAGLKSASLITLHLPPCHGPRSSQPPDENDCVASRHSSRRNHPAGPRPDRCAASGRCRRRASHARDRALGTVGSRI